MKLSVFRQALLLILLAEVPAIGQAVYFRHKISWQSRVPATQLVNLSTVRSWRPNVLWVDARASDDYETDHIPGAISLNEDRWNELLPQFLAQWSADKKVVVYCSAQSCNLAGEVARRLRDEAQLKNVFVLEGGWEEWVKNRK
ncbi:MAG: rhodanese-like domain-containing protein [Chthoniobacterales bacterium]